MLGLDACNILVNVVSTKPGGLTKLVSLGDVACNADTEAPPYFNMGHSSKCQLEVYSTPTQISIVALPHSVSRCKTSRRRQLENKSMLPLLFILNILQERHHVSPP